VLVAQAQSANLEAIPELNRKRENVGNEATAGPPRPTTMKM
jgi:hypothetical protein